MNRFELFRDLKNLVAFSEPYFREHAYNPFQISISPLYLELLRESTLKENKEASKASGTGMALLPLKWKLKQIKDHFFHRNNLKSRSGIPPILFLPVEPTHLLQFTPVWEALSKKEEPFFILTNRMNVFRVLKNDYPVIYLPRKLKIAHADEYKKLCAQQNKVILDFEPVNTGNLPLETIQRLLLVHGAPAWNLCGQLLEILEKLKPVSVLPGYDITYEGRLLTSLARDKQIPTYCIMHGSITGEPLDTIHLVDQFFLFGEAAKKDLISKGVSAEQLIVTGAPYLDKFEYIQKSIHLALKKNFALTDSRPYFIIAMSGPGHATSHAHFQLILQNLFEVAADYPEAQWVIKMHRKDRIENYNEVLAKHKNHRINIIAHESPGFPRSIFQWLQGATALLTGTSSVAVEAMSIGVPVITMDFMEEFQMVDFIDMGATIHVTDRTQLDLTIRNMIKSPQVFNEINERASVYASQYFFKSEVPAFENIVSFITSNQ
ncbi:MAG: UDP-N-acetylglucosamine 2-epimerase [Saprospiraceae bacterium]